MLAQGRQLRQGDRDDAPAPGELRGQLDGELVPLEIKGAPKAGPVEFNALKGHFKVFALEFRSYP